MTEKRALEDKNHDHSRYWGIGKMLCSDTFLTYLVVRLCFDWIQSFPLNPVLIEFEAAVVSQQSTFPTAFCPIRCPWKQRTSWIVFNNFSKARVKDVFSRWNATTKKRKAAKRNRNNSIQNGTSHVTDIEGVFNGWPITRSPIENEKGVISNCNFFSCVQGRSSKKIAREGTLWFHKVESCSET